MATHVFGKEVELLDRSKEKIAAGTFDDEAVTAIVEGYEKLLKESRRLVRFSDRSEKNLRAAHTTIATQKEELESAHDQLSERANELEALVAARTEALRLSQAKLEKLVERGISLSGETHIDRLLEQIIVSAKELANADGGTLYLRKDDELAFEVLRTTSLGIKLGGATGNPIDLPPVHLFDGETGAPNRKNVASFAALLGETILVDDAYTDDRFDFSGTRAFDEQTVYRSKSFLTVPLKPRGKDVLGVVQLLNAKDPETGEVIPFDPEIVGFVEALASQATVALADEDKWREFRVGAWLHDCGKVTTPEYVVDKATKLETIYNRIHEIRMRFEILLRDARIDILERKLNGEEIDGSELTRRQSELADDFAFLAECNIGGEFMSDERMDRVRDIGSRPWIRHFDDRIGLSATELDRFGDSPAPELPVPETLLADKPEHIVGRDNPNPYGDNPHGFKMEVPEHLYNYGEVYNLCIARGTLTGEERYKINEHIVQTITMLNALPYPKHLRRVPEIAANHHETMIGTGYPRRLTKDDLSVPSRIMAIADIFEALTASDRPHKAPKTLSEAVKIMSFMRNDQHIDPDLFDLFLESGVYREYADRFLSPEQTDEVAIDQFVSTSN